jgi:outer membrane protein OmpA-like peptidoglycan-associated protein
MSVSKALGAVAVLSLVAACTTPAGDPDRARTGVLTGALAGGLLGAAAGSGSRAPEMILGAGIGAIAGGAIGTHLDRQAAELRSSLGPQVGVVNTGNEIVVTMPQDILFAVDSADLRPDLRADLQTIAGNLQRYPDSIVLVTGHTDSTGTAGYNQRLSERRADAVASVLITSGVAARRVQARGAPRTGAWKSPSARTDADPSRRPSLRVRPLFLLRSRLPCASPGHIF